MNSASLALCLVLLTLTAFILPSEGEHEVEFTACGQANEVADAACTALPADGGSDQDACGKARALRQRLCDADQLARAMEPLEPTCSSAGGAVSPKAAMAQQCPVSLLGESSQSPQRQFMSVLNSLCKTGGDAWKPHLYNRLITALPRGRRAVAAKAHSSTVGRNLANKAAKPLKIKAKWDKGAKCGLSDAKAAKMEREMRCPAGMIIKRAMAYDGHSKMVIAVMLEGLFRIIRAVAAALMFNKRYLPSKECCRTVYPRAGDPLDKKQVQDRQGAFRWVPQTVKHCCAATPGEKKTCNAGGLSEELGEDAASSWGRRRRRRRRRRRAPRTKGTKKRMRKLVRQKRWVKKLSKTGRRVQTKAAPGKRSFKTVTGCLPLFSTSKWERNLRVKGKLDGKPIASSNLRCFAREPAKPLSFEYYKMIKSNFKANALHNFEAINKILLRKARGGRTSQAEASLQRRYEADMNREEGKMDLSMEDAMEEERDQLGAAVSWGNRRRRRFFKSIGNTFKKVGKFVGKTIKKAGGGILKGLAKLGAKLMKKMLPGLIKLAVKLCPKQYRPIIKKMVPHLLKGKIMKALMEGMPIIIKIVSKLVDKFFKPNSRAAIKYVVTKSLRIFANLDKAPGTTASKIWMVILSKYKVLLLEPFAAKLQLAGAIGIECMVRKFALHIVDPDYETVAYSNTCPHLTMTRGGCNHLAKGPNCGDNLKWNGKMGDWGPLDMEIVRLSKGKPVCSFTYKADQHSCDHDWNLIGKGIKSSDPRRKKKDCCQPAVLSKPRTSSSKYNPLLQVKGHNCRLWYLGTMSLVQLVVSLVYQIHSGVENRDCLADGCSNMERCSRSTCQSSNAGHKCRWVTNPSKAKYPWITNTVGGTCINRL